MLQDHSLDSLQVLCPLCDQFHERCIFGNGLYYQRPDCRNPHHRAAPSAFIPQGESECVGQAQRVDQIAPSPEVGRRGVYIAHLAELMQVLVDGRLWGAIRAAQKAGRADYWRAQ